MAEQTPTADDLQRRLMAAGIRQRLLQTAIDNGEVDTETGAPPAIRALVGGAPNDESRMATLKRFYPDAVRMPGTEDNFIFTDPGSKKLTVYNPKGLDVGDAASLAREATQFAGGAAGAFQGAVSGTAVAGPVGAVAGGVAGAGLGAAAGEEAFNIAGQQAGMVDTRGLGRRTADTAMVAGGEAAGQAAGGVVGKLLRAGAKGIFRGSSPETVKQGVDDFARFGATPTVGQATRTAWLDSLETLTSQFPGGRAVFRRKVQDTMDKAQEFVTRRAEQLTGKRAEPEVAGRTVQEGIGGPGGFVERFKERAGALYDEIDQFVPQDAPTAVGKTVAATKKLTGVDPRAPATTAILANPTVQKLGLALLADADAAGGAIPYGVVKALRSQVGNRLSSFSLVDDIPRSELKQLYAALSDDMRAAAQAAGPDALKAFTRADGFYKAGIKRIDDFLERLSSKVEPEKVFRDLETGGREGATKIRAVRKSVTDDEWNVVASTMITRLGRATPGQQGAVGEGFSLETFLTNWNKLADEAKGAFFEGGKLGSLRADMDAIARAAERARETSGAFRNPSGTAGSLTGQAMIFGGLGSSLAALVTGDAVAAGAVAGTVGAAAMGANFGARLMTSPRFVNWLADSTKIEPKGLGAHIGRLGAIAATSDPDEREAIMQYLGVLGSD